MDPRVSIPAPEAPTDPASAEAAAARATLELQAAMLKELAEMSMRLARAAERRALAAEAASEAADPAAFAASAGAGLSYAERLALSDIAADLADARADAAADRAGAPRPGAGPGAGHGDSAAEGDAAAPGAERWLADPHLAFHRASRAAQRSIALWRQLDREKDAAVAAEALAAVEARRARAAQRRRIAGRIAERVAHDHFETAIPGKDRDGEAILAAQAAVREARERLDDEALFADLAERPLSETVERICRDIGVSPDWARLAEEAWAQAELVGGPLGRGPVGKPLARFLDVAVPDRPRPFSIPPQEPRPPRVRSRRWRQRQDEAPPQPPETLRVLFVEPDGKGGWTDQEYKPPPLPATPEPPLHGWRAKASKRRFDD